MSRDWRRPSRPLSHASSPVVAGAPTPAALLEANERVDRALAGDRLHRVAHAKRFMERFTGDPEFRELLVSHGVDPRSAASDVGIDLDPLSLEPLWRDGLRTEVETSELEKWPLATEWAEFVAARRGLRAALKTLGDTPERSPKLHRWRQRQIARNESELGAHRNAAITYPILCYELAKGCSVGCWFCGLSAQKLEATAVYDAATQRLWRDLLTVAVDLFGTAAQTGFCYWATEPLDVPDYPEFIRDHWQITGALPQTTSAIPLRDVDKTRAVLGMRREAGGTPDRFSILTTTILRKVHDEFAAEELIDVELVLQNKGGLNLKTSAGRAREKKERLESEASTSGSYRENIGTIACVAGFLVNVVARSVALISPCVSSERWPKGYRVHAEGEFDDAAEFESVVRRMIEVELPESPPEREALAFRRDLTVKVLDDGFEATSPFAVHTVRGGELDRGLAELILAGATPREAVERLADDFADTLIVRGELQRLFDHGLIDDEPASRAFEADRPLVVAK